MKETDEAPQVRSPAEGGADRGHWLVDQPLALHDHDKMITDWPLDLPLNFSCNYFKNYFSGVLFFILFNKHFSMPFSSFQALLELLGTVPMATTSFIPY